VLEASGAIASGRGRGGSVRLVNADKSDAEETTPAEPAQDAAPAPAKPARAKAAALETSAVAA
jgi:hypothetical protein